MQLRHIRPGSIDWNDAINEGKEEDLARLSPEEVKKLRALFATEHSPKEVETPLKKPTPQHN